MEGLPYIAIDVEASGPYPERYALLSLGACLVTKETYSYEEAQSRGLIFYAEIRPHTLECDLSAMKVGCSQLEILEGKGDVYDARKNTFSHLRTIELLSRTASDPKEVANRFRSFIWSHTGGGGEVCGIADTTFFDSGWMTWWLGKRQVELAMIRFHHLGIDLRSLLVGHKKDLGAKLSRLGAPRNARPHHAGHDALFLANQTTVLFRELGFKL